MKLKFSRQIFEEYTNVKFHETSPSGSRVALCEQGDGRTGMAKLIVSFLTFANTTKT